MPDIAERLHNLAIHCLEQNNGEVPKAVVSLLEGLEVDPTLLPALLQRYEISTACWRVLRAEAERMTAT